MTPASDSVIVSYSTCHSCSASAIRVHHRRFPTVAGEGVSVALAGERLLQGLTRLLDHVSEPERREAVEHALADVRNYLLAAARESGAAGSSPADRKCAGTISGRRRTGVINVRPLGPWLAGARATALFEGEGLEVVRLVVPRGETIPPHATRGEASVQCLEGRVAFTANGVTHELAAGDLLLLEADQPHSIVGIDDASLLMTIALCGRSPGRSASLSSARREVQHARES